MCRCLSVRRHTIDTGRCRSVTYWRGMISCVSNAQRSRVRRRWGTDRIACALCAGPGSGNVAEHHLTHGVSVFLCEPHRDAGYQGRRGGRDFVDELTGMWSASGNLTPRHRRALAAHLDRVVRARATVRARPGSYSWPVMRAKAERRFAAGEPPRAVIFEFAETTKEATRSSRRFARCADGSARRGGSLRPHRTKIRPRLRRDRRSTGA